MNVTIEKNYIHSKNAYYTLFTVCSGLAFMCASVAATVGTSRFWLGAGFIIPYLLFTLLMVESYHAWRVKGGRWKYD